MFVAAVSKLTIDEKRLLTESFAVTGGFDTPLTIVRGYSTTE